ncbi:metal-dependent transcriptional regulator [Stetteria hydrogenophila]
MRSGRVTRRAEDYVEAVYEIVKRKGYARVKDVSRLLGVGPSTVSEMFKKLSMEGYLNYEKYGGVTLTEKGERLAVELRRKREALRDLLVILGVDRETAEREAHAIEHVVSRETMDRIAKFVEYVKTREDPKWLRRFREYYETGVLPECPKRLERGEELKSSP